MDLNKIIVGLNNKKYLTAQKADSDLSDEEKFVIRKYQPQNIFIVYGTLGPGRPNHHKIEHIKGRWSKVTIKGKLEAKGWGADLGYYGYVKASFGEEQQEISAFILFSDELTLNWS